MDFNTIPSFTNPFPQIIPTQIATPVQNAPPDVPPQCNIIYLIIP